MIINVFVPNSLISNQKQCDLFGELKIQKNVLTYFIILDENGDNSGLRKIGCIISPNTKKIPIDVPIILCRDNENNLFLLNKNIYFTGVINCSIYIYDENITDLSLDKKQHRYDLYYLISLLKSVSDSKKNISSRLFSNMKSIPLKVLPQSIVSILKTKIREYSIWNSWTDVLLGILFTYLVLVSINCADEFLNISQYMVFQLRVLLQSLKGSPVGLKLNLQLNNFLLDCFTYHVDLWATFLALMFPIITMFFIPLIAVCGFFGLSFQILLFLNIVSFLSLHAHCFYIYSAILYKIEIVGVEVLWKMAIGKRRNVIKNRVETMEQMNRQCYLTVLFLTYLLFVLPTIAMYYIVFASVRSMIYILKYCLLMLRKYLLQSSIDIYLKWIFHCYNDINKAEVMFIKLIKKPNLPVTTIFRVILKKGLPGADILKKTKLPAMMGPREYFNSILNGNIVHFS